jgi:signal peptidase I
MDSREISRVLLAEGNEVLLQTAGLSMGHAIRGGEAVVIRAVPERDIRFGDVLVFDRAGQLVCHRVVRVRNRPTGREFVTKGDPLVGCDDPIPFAAVLGRVIRIKWPEGDFRMDTWRGRWSNRILAATSLAAEGMVRLLPWKGALRKSGRGVRAAWRFLCLPSRLFRQVNERLNRRRRG